MDRTTGKVEVTAHNHAFAVDAPLEGPTETRWGQVTASHVCLTTSWSRVSSCVTMRAG